MRNLEQRNDAILGNVGASTRKMMWNTSICPTKPFMEVHVPREHVAPGICKDQLP